MSTLSLAAAGLRGHARRLAATALAIVLSVGFVATTLLGLDALERGVGETVAGDVVDRDLVVWPDDQPLEASVVDGLRDEDGLTVVEASAQVYGSVGSSSVIATTAPRGPGVELLEGSMPSGPGQVVAASTTSYAVGDTVSVEPYRSDGTMGPAADVEVVGIMDVGDSPMLAWNDVLVAEDSLLRQWDPEFTYSMVTLDLAGADEAAVRSLIADAAPGTEVLTGAEAATELVAQATGGLDLLGSVLLGFGAIAVVTSAMVIANTFAIVLAQRTRELALLRCVGATRSQVRRTVLLEALALGAVASAVGVLLAVAITWIAAAMLGEVDLGTPVTLRPGLSTVALLAPWLVGVVVTLGAAWWPTRRATRVAPLAALQPVATPPAASRPGLLRIVAAVLLLGAGGAGLVLSAGTNDILLGVASGLTSFLGVLFAAVFFVPASIRALGAALRGVTGRLAVGNTVSNPGRAAATSAALLIGVTLITMTSVGAASAARTADQEIDAQFPADVLLMPMCCEEPAEGDSAVDESAGDDAAVDDSAVGDAAAGEGAGSDDVVLDDVVLGSLSGDAGARVKGLDGVAASAAFPAAWLEIRTGDDEWWTQTPVYGVDQEAGATVLRDPEILTVLAPGTIGFTSEQLYYSDVEVGDLVQVTGRDGVVDATVVEVAMGDFVMPVADLEALDSRAQDSSGLLLRLDEEADLGAVVSDIREIVAEDNVYVVGGAAARAELNNVLNVLVLVMTALLGVAVIIAVVGIANTLALSVLERTRENALLRALGLTRSQLRGMLTLEGVLLAVVSAVLGIALGVVYAWFGVRTLMPEDTDVALAFPVARLAIILAVAILAGLLAAVLPARRAARIAPAAGLATVV